MATVGKHQGRYVSGRTCSCYKRLCCFQKVRSLHSGLSLAKLPFGFLKLRSQEVNSS